MGSFVLFYKNLKEHDCTVALILGTVNDFQQNEVQLVMSELKLLLPLTIIQITDIGCKGNLLLNRMVGSHVIVIPPLQYKSGLKQMMEKLAEKL